MSPYYKEGNWGSVRVVCLSADVMKGDGTGLEVLGLILFLTKYVEHERVCAV